MTGRRKLQPEEQALWDKVASTARPLDRGTGGGEAVGAGPPAPPEPAKDVGGATRSPRRGARPATQDPAPARPGRIDRRTEQRLRRGRLEVEARLDLHGMTQAAAHAALRRFLAAAQKEGRRLVLIITGKGGSPLDRERADFGMEPRGVLKRQVPLWLASPELAPLVAGFRPAHERHGGEGALYVQVRKARA